MKSRTQTEVIQNMLSITKNKVWQDQLIKRSKISPQMFKKYEKALVQSNRIEKTIEGKRIYYKRTKQGEETLKSLLHMHRIQTNILRTLNLHKKTKDLNSE